MFGTEKETPPVEPSENIVLEADYAEDRPIALLAERQRKCQGSWQGQYVDADMPAF